MTVRQRLAVCLAIGALVGAMAAVAFPFPARAQSAADVPALIVDAAERNGADPAFLLRVAWCESSYRPYVVGPWGHVGNFQWEARSFNEEARWYGVPGVSPWEPYWNIELAAFAVANGRAWRWKACW